MRATLVPIFFLVLLCGSWLHAQPAGWQVVGQMPLRVAGAEAVVTDSLALILGGFSDSLFANVNWIQTYNCGTGEWQRVGSMAQSRRDFVAAKSGDSVYFCGGSSPGDSTMEVYPLSLPPHSSLYASNRRLARSSPAGTIQSGSFCVFGGQRPGGPGNPVPYLVEFNLAARLITYQNDSLFHQSSQGVGQMAVAIDSNVYVFGGVFNAPSRDIYRFNILTKTFIKLPIELLEPRAFGKAVRIGTTNKIMILGGRNERSPAMNTTEIFEVLSGSSYRVSPAPPILVARSKLMAVCQERFVYVFGGFDGFQNVVRLIERRQVVTGIPEHPDHPGDTYELLQNYPNPFNPLTALKFRVPHSGFVSLRVFDILGRELAAIINGHLAPGNYSMSWDATGLPSGVYMYQLQSGAFRETKKMILLR